MPRRGKQTRCGPSRLAGPCRQTRTCGKRRVLGALVYEGPAWHQQACRASPCRGMQVSQEVGAGTATAAAFPAGTAGTAAGRHGRCLEFDSHRSGPNPTQQPLWQLRRMPATAYMLRMAACTPFPCQLTTTDGAPTATSGSSSGGGSGCGWLNPLNSKQMICSPVGVVGPQPVVCLQHHVGGPLRPVVGHAVEEIVEAVRKVPAGQASCMWQTEKSGAAEWAAEWAAERSSDVWPSSSGHVLCGLCARHIPMPGRRSTNETCRQLFLQLGRKGLPLRFYNQTHASRALPNRVDEAGHEDGHIKEVCRGKGRGGQGYKQGRMCWYRLPAANQVAAQRGKHHNSVACSPASSGHACSIAAP